MISVSEYLRDLSGYTIVDCVVRSRDIYGVVVQNDMEAAVSSAISQAKVTKRFIGVFLDEPFDDQLGATDLTGFLTLNAGAAVKPAAEFVCVDSDGQTYAVGKDVDETQANIPSSMEGPLRGEVSRLRTIDGWLFFAGGFHSVAKRLGKDEWQNLCLNLPQPRESDLDDVSRSDDMALKDIDGFSVDELYVVAGRGRIWRLKDGSWARMPFPSNMYMESVCCAGDGFVYVGAQSGALFRGRDEHWEMIHGPEFTLPFQDIVWHAGRLWCTSDYGLWTLENGRLVSADVPSEVRVCAGHLSVGDGVMLMAGVHGAAVHDGKDWQVIFTKLHMEEAIKG